MSDESTVRIFDADPEQVVSVTVGELEQLLDDGMDVEAGFLGIGGVAIRERTCTNKAVEISRMAPIEFRTDDFICSACHETFCADRDGINHPIDWAFCPNCGARVVVE